MRMLLATAVMLAPAPAAAQLQDGLCHDMRRVIASAGERETFGSVTYHETWRHFRLFELCRPNRSGPVDRVACSWRMPSSEPIIDAMAAEAARCLPRARRDDAGAIGGARFFAARFVLGNLAIYLEQSVSAPDTLSDTAALVIVIDEDE